MKTTDRFALNSQVAWRDLDGHIFAVTPDNRQHELSGAVEHAVWHELAENAMTLAELVAFITASFEVEATEATADLREFLDACLVADLVRAA